VTEGASHKVLAAGLTAEVFEETTVDVPSKEAGSKPCQFG
jgi:hypothetical protein